MLLSLYQLQVDTPNAQQEMRLSRVKIKKEKPDLTTIEVSKPTEVQTKQEESKGSILIRELVHQYERAPLGESKHQVSSQTLDAIERVISFLRNSSKDQNIEFLKLCSQERSLATTLQAMCFEELISLSSTQAKEIASKLDLDILQTVALMHSEEL